MACLLGVLRARIVDSEAAIQPPCQQLVHADVLTVKAHAADAFLCRLLPLLRPSAQVKQPAEHAPTSEHPACVHSLPQKDRSHRRKSRKWKSRADFPECSVQNGKRCLGVTAYSTPAGAAVLGTDNLRLSLSWPAVQEQHKTTV